MKTRSFITMALAFMVNAVLFGVGIVAVLSIDALRMHAVYLIPAVVVVSLAATPFISWLLAPRLRLRHQD